MEILLEIAGGIAELIADLISERIRVARKARKALNERISPDVLTEGDTHET
ncbi:MAG: hypothetical protein IKR73_03730 [Oscillospiraceae bacterium]|nr:hypothetical protein [Oscillospiraceae bacterium]